MISPLLIVIRVALGHGWSKNTADTIGTGADFKMRNPSSGGTAVSRPSEYPLSSIGTVAIGLDKTVYSAGTVSAISREGGDKKVSALWFGELDDWTHVSRITISFALLVWSFDT